MSEGRHCRPPLSPLYVCEISALSSTRYCLPCAHLVTIKRIAVITSGGNVLGLNAAIRAVTRAAPAYAPGVQRGYEGLIEGDFIELTS